MAQVALIEQWREIRLSQEWKPQACRHQRHLPRHSLFYPAV